MLRRLLHEVARPNGTASLLMVGIAVCESSLLFGVPEPPSPRLALGALVFCIGGYAGSLWANWGAE